MNTSLSTPRKLAISALGMAVLIPLMATSATASPADGSFEVTATDSDDPAVFATAGSIRAVDNPEGPGEVIPPAEDTVVSFSCGPLTLNITQDMRDFSKANEDLFNAGRASEMVAHADGWKMIASGDLTNGMTTGLVSNPAVVKLGDDINALTGTANYRALAANSCFVEDNRIPTAENATYMYESVEAGRIAEAKWLREEGELRKVMVSDYGNSVVIDRFGSSNRYPAQLTQNDGVFTYVDIVPTEVVDGVRKIRRSPQAGGGTTYQLWGSGTTDALRKNGPNYISVDSTGKILGLKYADGNGAEKTVNLKGSTNAEIITNYNKTSGQTWDGSLPNFDGYEFSIPFLPAR